MGAKRQTGMVQPPRSAFTFAPLLPPAPSLPQSSFRSVPEPLRPNAVRAANFSLQAFRDLTCGNVSEGRPSTGTVSSWRSAREVGRCCSHEILRGVVADHEFTGEFHTGEGSATEESDAAAFNFMTAKVGEGVSGDLIIDSGDIGGVDDQGRPRPPRGAVCEDADIDELALPPEGFKGRDAADISKDVRFFFSEEGRSHLLRPSHAIN